jgi:hypothetical protein
MNDEQIKRIIEDTYDESKEDTLVSWIRDCYSKKMLWVMVNVYLGYLILLALIVFSSIKFFRTDHARSQILYAAIFVCCNLWMGFVSVFGWVMMQRPTIKREIKRLELRIVELSEAVRKP